VTIGAPHWLSLTEQRVWRAYLKATQRLRDQLDRELQRDVGLSLAYFEILVMLSEAPGRTLRMGDLAVRTSSSRSRLSHAVDRLEEKGWVERRSCPMDKRGAYASLTDAGFDVLAAAAPSHVESVRRHLFDLLTPAEIDALGSISETIATHLVCPTEDNLGVLGDEPRQLVGGEEPQQLAG
jgi:DNA-binding MarR family transcriptional regulator